MAKVLLEEVQQIKQRIFPIHVFVELLHLYLLELRVSTRCMPAGPTSADRSDTVTLVALHLFV